MEHKTNWNNGEIVNASILNRIESNAKELEENKVNIQEGKQLSSNDFSDAEKEKLSTIQANAEENINAFSSVKVGSIIAEADRKQSSIEFAAGENIVLTADSDVKKITISTEGGGNYIGTTAPAKTNLLWTDMSVGGVLKYYNGTEWVAMKAVWG